MTAAFVDVAPIDRVQGRIRIPGSKSVSIRAMLLAALSEGTTELVGVLDSADTRVMAEALTALGVPVTVSGATTQVRGAAAFPIDHAELFVGNSGLSMRTLLPVLAFMSGRYKMHGVARMHERPVNDLVDALAAVGARISYEAIAGFLPLSLTGTPRLASRQLSVRGDVSSQFLTGLLQAAPGLSADGDVDIRVEGELISRPYIALTLELMARFGVAVDGAPTALNARFRIPAKSRYKSPGRYVVEGDASSASYFLALAALSGGPLTVEGVGSGSTQADIQFATFLQSVGASVHFDADAIVVRSAGLAGGFRPRAFDEDFNHMPDAAMTAAVVALFADGPCRLRNIGSWRVKETDRIDAMARELTKCGAVVRSGEDWLAIEPAVNVKGASIETYDDHRMAMCFAIVAVGGVSIRICDPRCVDKTYPDFFTALTAIRAAR